jgi:hypothetical protein
VTTEQDPQLSRKGSRWVVLGRVTFSLLIRDFLPKLFGRVGSGATLSGPIAPMTF